MTNTERGENKCKTENDGVGERSRDREHENETATDQIRSGVQKNIRHRFKHKRIERVPFERVREREREIVCNVKEGGRIYSIE